MRRVLTVVVLCALLYLLPRPSFAIYVPKQAPDVRGKSLADARSAAAGVAMRLNVLSGPEDGVVETQDPLPGTAIVARSPVMNVTMQAKPTPAWAQALINALKTPQQSSTVTVPDLYGMTHDDAFRTLDEAGLRGQFVQASGNDDWRVAVQSILAGTDVPRRAQVVVTMGPPVPALVGKVLDDAGSLLIANGLQLGQTTFGKPQAEPRRLLSQQPTAGTYVLPQSAVDVTLPAVLKETPPVSEDKHPRTPDTTPAAKVPVQKPVATPCVVGMTPGDASQKLSGVRLLSRSNGGTAWPTGLQAVITQTPVCQERIPRHSVVVLTVGLTPVVKWPALALLLAAGLLGGWKLFRPVPVPVVTWQAHPDDAGEHVAVVSPPQMHLEWRSKAGVEEVIVLQQPRVTERMRG